MNGRTIFVFFIAVGALVVLFYNLRRYPKIYASRAWPETVGKIKSVEIKAISYEDYFKAWAEFTFAYTVPGSELQGMLKTKSYWYIVNEHPVGST